MEDLDPKILDRSGSDLFLITVTCDQNNIDIESSESECLKHGIDTIVVVKDDSNLQIVSVEPFK